MPSSEPQSAPPSAESFMKRINLEKLNEKMNAMLQVLLPSVQNAAPWEAQPSQNADN
jgi:hypothetical protein